MNKIIDNLTYFGIGWFYDSEDKITRLILLPFIFVTMSLMILPLLFAYVLDFIINLENYD